MDIFSSPAFFKGKKIILLPLLFSMTVTDAQKKLILADSSKLTGIVLPSGTKQDKRKLSIMSATILMEMVSKNAGTPIKNTEIFYLPKGNNGFTADSLSAAIELAGWKTKLIEKEKEYLWLEKSGKHILAYFSPSKKEINLYFAEAEKSPSNISNAAQNNPQQKTIESTKIAQHPGNNPANAAVAGTWIKSGSVNPSYADAASWGSGGYSKDQYNFYENGTYTFYSKSFGYSVSNLILAKESGTFTINGNSITISPASSEVESWSKEGNADKWGKLISTEKRPLEKATYQFTKHYFSGIQQWNLILQTSAATNRDGAFGDNPNFGNAYFYAPASNNNTAIDLPKELNNN